MDIENIEVVPNQRIINVTVGSCGPSGDTQNIPKLIEVSLTDLGVLETDTEEVIKQALATYILGLNLNIGKDEIYFFKLIYDGATPIQEFSFTFPFNLT